MRKANNNAISIHELKHLPNEFDEQGKAIIKEGELKAINTYLFAYDTDLTGKRKNEISRYKEIYTTKVPPLRIICVVNKGCWAFHQPANDWISTKVANPLDEVMNFIVLFLNSYPEVSKLRKIPRIGNYLVNY